MNSDTTAEKTFEELRVIESNVQSLSGQKQNIQFELNEIENALQELNGYKDDAYKLVSGILLKTPTDSLVKDLENRKKASEMKMDAIERQEKMLEKKAEELRESISKKEE